MDILDRIKELAAKRSLSINSLESKLGFARGYLYTWKKKTPGIDRVQKVADFFNVSTDYLLGRTDNQSVMEPGHIDVEDIINNTSLLTSRTVPITKQDRKMIAGILESYLNSKEGQQRLRKYGHYGDKE